MDTINTATTYSLDGELAFTKWKSKALLVQPLSKPATVEQEVQNQKFPVNDYLLDALLADIERCSVVEDLEMEISIIRGLDFFENLLIRCQNSDL